MTQPAKPRAEIVVHKAGSYVLWIFAHSNDARLAVEQHAPRFGNLYPPRSDHYDLYVSEDYEHDLDGIVTYLQGLA